MVLGSVLNRREMLGGLGGWFPESGEPLGVKVKEVMRGECAGRK